MFARISEIVLACWLVAGALLFADPQGGAFASPLVDAVLAGAIVVVSLAAWIGHRSGLRLLNFGTAAVVVASAYLAADHPADMLYQNRLIVACLLVMFCIVPTRAWRVPAGWERVLRRPETGDVTGGDQHPA